MRTKPNVTDAALGQMRELVGWQGSAGQLAHYLSTVPAVSVGLALQGDHPETPWSVKVKEHKIMLRFYGKRLIGVMPIVRRRSKRRR